MIQKLNKNLIKLNKNATIEIVITVNVSAKQLDGKLDHVLVNNTDEEKSVVTLPKKKTLDELEVKFTSDMKINKIENLGDDSTVIASTDIC